MSYQEVGGCTTFRKIYSTRNIEIKLFTTKIRRKIHHFMDYGVKPNLISTDIIEKLQEVTELLPFSNLTFVFKYKSGFSSMKLCFRSFNTSELFDVFGISRLLFLCHHLISYQG